VLLVTVVPLMLNNYLKEPGLANCSAFQECTRWFKYDPDCLHLFTSVNSPGHIWTTLYMLSL